MTISFFEPGEIPQPKDKVKIELLAVDVYPDRWRIKVNINLTPFQVRPNVAVVLLKDLPAKADPFVVSDMTILGTMHNKMEFTMHIKNMDDPTGEYLLKIRLYYEQDIHDPADDAQILVRIPTVAEMESQGSK